MNNSNNINKAAYTGIWFPGALALVFIALKLTGDIDWPWLWVLSPLWVAVIIVGLILLLVYCLAGLGRC